MRELIISFVLLFLVFITLDVVTTSYSRGLRQALMGEIDSELKEGADKILDAVGHQIDRNMSLKEVYPLLIENSIGWVEFFNKDRKLVRRTTPEAEIIPEEFPDTARFWDYRYAIFPHENGYVLLKASESYMGGLKRLSRISTILRFIIYASFIGLGIYIFNIFSFPFKKVREFLGQKSSDVKYSLEMIEKLVDSYREKLNNVKKREKQVQRRLFLSKLGENVTQVLHEIRNSTGAILGFGKLVEDENVRSGIIEETERLKRFSMHLLSLSGPLQLKKIEFSLGDLIMEIIERFEKPGVEVKTDISDPLRIRGDEELLRKAFYNILDNSFDACSEGDLIEVSAIKDSDKIEIIIRDTGKGMDKKTLSSVFNLFFTRKDGGVGVGMVFSKRIIESHGGDIEIESQEGKGTRVKVVLQEDSDE